MSESRWRLVPYISKSGRIPAHEFLEDMATSDPDAYAYFEDVLRPLLEDFGSGLGEPHFKRLPPTDFSEIRWRGVNNGHHRLYCSIEKGRRIVLYHAVTKRWKKFDQADRQICKDRERDYHSREYNPNERLQSRARAESEATRGQMG